MKYVVPSDCSWVTLLFSSMNNRVNSVVTF